VCIKNVITLENCVLILCNNLEQCVLDIH